MTKGTRGDAAMYTVMLRICEKAKDSNAAVRVWERVRAAEVRRLDEIFFSAFLKAVASDCAKGEDLLKRIDGTLGMMKEVKVAPSKGFLAEVLRLCNDFNLVDTMKEVVQALEAVDGSQTTFTLNALLRTCATNRESEQIILTKLVGDNKVIPDGLSFGLLLGNSMKRGDSERAWEVVELMEQFGHPIEPVYHKVILASATAKDPDGAKAILAKIKARGHTPTRSHELMVMDIFIEHAKETRQSQQQQQQQQHQQQKRESASEAADGMDKLLGLLIEMVDGGFQLGDAVWKRLQPFLTDPAVVNPWISKLRRLAKQNQNQSKAAGTLLGWITYRRRAMGTTGSQAQEVAT